MDRYNLFDTAGHLGSTFQVAPLVVVVKQACWCLWMGRGFRCWRARCWGDDVVGSQKSCRSATQRVCRLRRAEVRGWRRLAETWHPSYAPPKSRLQGSLAPGRRAASARASVSIAMIQAMGHEIFLPSWWRLLPLRCITLAQFSGT